jgi:hypothetical protein
MKRQKKPAERKSVLTPSLYPSETCRPEYNCSSKNSFFHYSIIETDPVNYEYGSSPIRITTTLFTFSGLIMKTNFTITG